MIAQSINEEILTVIDRSSRARVPRLQLNLDDNDYFRARLTDQGPAPSPSKPSHELIDQAFCEARDQIERILSGFDEKDHGDTLDRWINFMQQRARVVLLQVPNDADAYRMFETLNDRGLRVPDEFTPVALVEAKLTEDDGTARDKVARVQRLRTLRDAEGNDYTLIACIAGRGFKVRREDMRRLLQATDGKAFTLSTMHLLIDHTRIREYRVR